MSGVTPPPGGLPLMNPLPPLGPPYARAMGLALRDLVKRKIKNAPLRTPGGYKHGPAGKNLESSVDYEVIGPNQVQVFYDLSKAKYARQREVGGTIKAFRARKPFQRMMRMAFGKWVADPRMIEVRNPRPMLFIPLTQAARDRRKGLVFGVDYVLKEQVEQRGSFVMRDTIREMIGPRKDQLEKLMSGQIRLAQLMADSKGQMPKNYSPTKGFDVRP